MALHSSCSTPPPAESASRAFDLFPALIAVLIPAWDPGPELIHLAHALTEMQCGAILVIDDGSGTTAQPIFHQLQSNPAITVLRHARNFGKGRSLRTGLRAFLADLPDYAGIVTADADGQHLPEDIARVAAALAESPQKVVLGARHFPAEMPLRSRIGNIATRYVFHAATGAMLADTQTGLRGIPREILPQLLEIPGDRYEYEMAMLAYLCRYGCTQMPIEVPIQTIYNDNNRSSHFDPLRDSFRIYSALARHCLKSKGSRSNAELPMAFH